MPEPKQRRGWRTFLKRSALTLGALIGLLVVAGLGSTGCLSAFGGRADPARMAELARESRYEEGRFVNVVPPSKNQPDAAVMKEFFFGNAQRTPPAPLPVDDPRPHWQKPPPTGLRVTWLGHSTLLIEVDGRRVLTDPVWGERASPSTLVGPKRFHPSPVSLDQLPQIDAVVISHDHYDHLDMPTIEELSRREVTFYAPLGIRAHLEKWGVRPDRIVELDWWGEAVIPGSNVTLVATPARHFSGRGLTNRDSTLWASWVIRTPSRRVFFSGDTGLTPQFETIRERQGPFDLVMLEVGAFHPSWGDIHLGPDNAAKALQMLGGGPLLPVHWGTFNLAIHPWDEPIERLTTLSREQGFPLLTPRLGSPIDVGARDEATQPLAPWWRTVEKGTKSALADVPTF